MKKLDIEAYLDGDLKSDALAQFEQEMRQNPAFAQQVEAQRKLAHHLRTQLVREQVNAALADKPVSGGKPRWGWAVVVVLLLCLAGYFFFRGNKQAATPATTTPPPRNEWKPEMQPTVPSEPATPATTPTTVEEEKTTPSQPKPIAVLPLPDFPAPNVRGENGNNTAWKAMLDKLWYTQLPPKATSFGAPFGAVVAKISKRDFENAFVELETLEGTLPANDTLSLLKGYCLLEMGEGADALRNLERLEGGHSNWKAWLEWHRALARLISSGKDQALPEFQSVAKQSNHSYQQQARKALNLLE